MSGAPDEPAGRRRAGAGRRAGRRATVVICAVVLGLLAAGTAMALRSAAPARPARPAALSAVPAVAHGPAYRFTARDVTGRPVRLAAYAGRPVVINFFASWCAPCLREAAALRRVAAHFAVRVAFVGVATADSANAAAAFARRFGWSWPVVVDQRYQLATGFHVFGIPTTVVVDARGRIAAILPGAVTADGLTQRLDRVLA